jgi:hypothetical protein
MPIELCIILSVLVYSIVCHRPNTATNNLPVDNWSRSKFGKMP